MKSPSGELIRLGELGHFEELPAEQTIYHKNLRRVAYVTGETAGRTPAEAILGMQAAAEEEPVPGGSEVVWTGEGEWKITLDVFRDLGLAFGGALLLIYILMVYQTGSYLMPLVQMISIPLTIIGIMPGFWLLNVLTGGVVGGYADPVYFTATAMIGMIALAGIADRNAILLLDFIKSVRDRGVAAERGADRKRRGPLPADPAHGGRRDARGLAHHPRPGLFRAGMVADLWTGRFDRVHVAARSRRVLDAVSIEGASFAESGRRVGSHTASVILTERADRGMSVCHIRTLCTLSLPGPSGSGDDRGLKRQRRRRSTPSSTEFPNEHDSGFFGVAFADASGSAALRDSGAAQGKCQCPFACAFRLRRSS